MWIQQDNNVICTCLVVREPVYTEEKGVYKSPCTVVRAKCRISTSEGTVDDYVDLSFYSDFAIPAKATITVGDRLVVCGRTLTKEYYRKATGRNYIYRHMTVEFFFPVVTDPYNFLSVLQTQQELITQKWLARAAVMADETEADTK